MKALRFPTVLALSGLLLTAVLANGCGYALVGRATNLPPDVEDIYVAPFENATPRQQVEQFVTEAIAEELVRRPRYGVVSSADEADAVLEGTVNRFGLTPIAFDQDGRATEYEISVTARVVLERVGSDEVLWANERYVFRENYQVDTGEAGFLDREDVALREVAERFAETMVSDLLEGF